jgi:hypothetical protein
MNTGKRPAGFISTPANPAPARNSLAAAGNGPGTHSAWIHRGGDKLSKLLEWR